MDLVDELMLDHMRITSMLDHFSDVAAEDRPAALHTLVAELSRHEAAEERVVYPALERCAAGGAAIAADRLAEQHEAEEMLADVERVPADGDGASALVDRLGRAVAEHAHAEEATVFWLLRTNLSEAERRRLASQYAKAKLRAPTHPHPRTAPGKTRARMVAPLAAVVDRFRDRRHVDSGSEHAWEPPTDALTVLKADHDTIRLLLDQFERQGEGAPRALLDQLSQQVSKHSAAELERLYPLLQATGEDTQSLVKQARLDHEEVAMRLLRLTSVRISTAEFRDEGAALVHDLRAHLETEEQELFPVLGTLDRPELEKVGEQLRAARRRAPASLHPHAPKSALGARLTDRWFHAVEAAERRTTRR